MTDQSSHLRTLGEVLAASGPNRELRARARAWGSASRQLSENTADLEDNPSNPTPSETGDSSFNRVELGSSDSLESLDESESEIDFNIAEDERPASFYRQLNAEIGSNGTEMEGRLSSTRPLDSLQRPVLRHRSIINQRFGSLPSLDNDNQVPEFGFSTGSKCFHKKACGKSTKSATRIQYGNRSFEPKAKFDRVHKAFPAKPGVAGFSYCHEKALVAESVLQSINFNDDSSDVEDPTDADDTFLHFWSETNVVEGDDSVPSESFGMDSFADGRRVQNRNTATTDHDPNNILTTMTDAMYRQWDNDTSIANNPLNYDLWNDDPPIRAPLGYSMTQVHQVPRPRRSTSNNTSSIGVGTDDRFGSSPMHTFWPVITERIGSQLRSRRPLQDFQRSIFLGLNNGSRSRFGVDRPSIPTEVANQIPPEEMPRPFLEQTVRTERRNENLSLSRLLGLQMLNDYENPESTEENTETDDFEDNGSVFYRDTEVIVDDTPTSLWSNVVPPVETNGGSTENVSDEYFLFFSDGSDNPSVPPPISDTEL